MSRKGGKYLQKENIHWEGEEGKRKRKKIFEGDEKRRRKRRKIFLEKQSIRSVGEKKNGGGKGGKYMEKENILPAEEKKN